MNYVERIAGRLDKRQWCLICKKEDKLALERYRSRGLQLPIRCYPPPNNEEGKTDGENTKRIPERLHSRQILHLQWKSHSRVHCRFSKQEYDSLVKEKKIQWPLAEAKTVIKLPLRTQNGFPIKTKKTASTSGLPLTN